MSQYDELKRLAEAALNELTEINQDWPTDGDYFDCQSGPEFEYLCAANPVVVMTLIAENQQLRTDRDYCRRVAEHNKEVGEQLRAEIAGLKTGYQAYEQVNAELKAGYEIARMRIKEMDLLFGRYILAMRSALIEEEHGKGPAAAMEWIYNSLAGPGELPPEGETDSQAYFDREIVAVDNGMQEVMAFHEGRRAAMGKGEQS